MYLWLKIFHICAMALWFCGLFFLPTLLAARVRRADMSAQDDARFDAMGRSLYFAVTTPAGVVTVAAGMVLIAYGPFGAWLVMKLVVVCLAVLLHLYLGVVLHEYARGRPRHGAWVFRALAAVPLVLLLGLAALTGAKPDTVDPLPPPPGVSDAGFDSDARRGGGMPQSPPGASREGVSPSRTSADAALRAAGVSDASRP